MAKRLVHGDSAPRVWCALKQGEDPWRWQPTRKVIATLQDTRLILINGADSEPWLMGASLPSSRVVDASAGLESDLLTVPTVTHSHGGGSEHTHEGKDGLVWLDPRLARRQAETVAARIASAFPELKARVDHNLKSLRAEFADLDQRLEVIAGTLDRARLFSAHRSYGYLGRRLGVEILDLDLDPRNPPNDARIREVERKLRENGANVLLWTEAPTAAVRVAWAAIGLESVFFPLVASPDGSGQSFAVRMRESLDRLAAAIGA